MSCCVLSLCVDLTHYNCKYINFDVIQQTTLRKLKVFKKIEAPIAKMIIGRLPLYVHSSGMTKRCGMKKRFFVIPSMLPRCVACNGLYSGWKVFSGDEQTSEAAFLEVNTSIPPIWSMIWRQKV